MFLKLTIWLTGLIYGKYSIQYIEFFRKRNLQPDVRPCIKDHYLPHFFPFFKRVAEVPLLKTSEKIIFDASPFGYTFKNCPFSKRKPETFSAYRIGKNVLTAYGFAGRSIGAKHREIAFFLDNKFVLGEISFSLGKSEKPDIEKIYAELASKYKISIIDSAKGFYIEDPADSLIYCHNNGFELTLSYFNPNVEGLLEAMELWFKEPVAQKKEKESKVKL
ncbi:MAG: hypothetical protein PWP35_2102 [Bacteroidales bacterium]|jgi:hypothetical protein|nr:hypothetical protein [Bacteroidales bacterium]NLH52296.1 hypothetical protein [Bacteroidales bacterium]